MPQAYRQVLAYLQERTKTEGFYSQTRERKEVIDETEVIAYLQTLDSRTFDIVTFLQYLHHHGYFVMTLTEVRQDKFIFDIDKERKI